MVTTYTFQDFEEAPDRAEFIQSAIAAHKSSDVYKLALIADRYDRQENVTINEYARLLYSMRVTEDKDSGERHATAVKGEDFTAANNKLASNFFNRLNTQRVQYSLGNGVSFVQPDEAQDGGDKVKEAMGEGFDRRVTEAAYHACIHGVSFVFWNSDRVHAFEITEFCPLYDERTGELRAGIRFWQMDATRPLSATLYTEDGFSEWRAEEGEMRPLDRDGNPTGAEVVQAYLTETAYVEADDETMVIGEENYGRLPIVPMWASRLKQSTLVGLRAHIDAYDLVKSGFANDLQDCAMAYWIVENAMGMTDADMAEFRDRLRLEHIAKVDGTDGAKVTQHVQEIPTQARLALLKELRDGIYEDFGALDVHAVAAGATNDHIDAAYQPMDENAADFEYWVAECVRQLVRLAGFEDEPIFQRNRISNKKEQVEMVVQEAQWLDTATILRKLPNVRPDEVAAILAAMDAEDMGRFGIGEEPTEPPAAEPTEGGE
jgi:SPP1 family phage portal protein